MPIAFRLLIFGLCLLMAGCAPPGDGQPELHGVSVYEGIDEAEDAYRECRWECRDQNCENACPRPAYETAARGHAAVRIDRPGKEVILMLGAYDPVAWTVEPGERTQLSQIVLFGHQSRDGSVTVNGRPFETVERRPDLSAPSTLDEPAFRRLAGPVANALGFDRFDSFQASYEAPAQGFTIDRIDTKTPALDPDYLRHALTRVAEDDPLTIEGVLAGRSGRFRPDGILVEGSPLTSSSHVAVSQAAARAYVWGDRGVRIVDLETNRTERLIQPPDRALGLGHFRALAHDPVRKRLIALFQAGGATAEVAAYDFDTAEWTRIGELGRLIPSALFYVAEQDHFFISGTSFGATAFVGVLTPDGLFSIRRELGIDQLPGITDLFDPGNESMPPIHLVGVSGNRVALASRGAAQFGPDAPPGPIDRIYVLNVATGEVNLTYYDASAPAARSN